MPANTPPRSAKTQTASRRNRGEPRAQAAAAPALPCFNIDPARPETWPTLVRERDICRDRSRNYAGILPVSRAAWRSMIIDGYVSAGLLLGGKVRAWPREELEEIIRHGVKRRPRGRAALAREAQRRAAAEAASVNT
jgi:hypothetical protein